MGFDKAPQADLGTPTDVTDCFNKCKTSYDTTIAVDFWNINDANRNAGNICWCQDACTCLAPSKPGGTAGKLYLEDGIDMPASCGYNLHEIKEAQTDKGWCKSPLDAAPTAAITNQHNCFTTCRDEKKAVASDFFVRDGKKVCFCQSECPCLMASKVGGGDGLLAIAEDLTPSKNMCYKLVAGIGKQGWCRGIDSAPEDTSATTAKECYDKCKATHDSTIAVDFWDINHPIRTAANVCWCQDKCDCTSPSKSDGGNGILFIAEGAVKGDSCGTNVKTIVEGNDNSHCEGAMTNPSSEAKNMYACQENCEADGKDVASWLNNAETEKCKCQASSACTCTKAGDFFGYRFMPEKMHTPHMCESQMKCGTMKDAYKAGQCCGNPTKVAKLRWPDDR